MSPFFPPFSYPKGEEGLHWRLEPRCQVSFDRLWLVARRIAPQYRAVGAHEEFRKVPLDRLGAENPRLLRFARERNGDILLFQIGWVYGG